MQAKEAKTFVKTELTDFLRAGVRDWILLIFGSTLCVAISDFWCTVQKDVPLAARILPH